jgi:uncharacterized protein YbjT (DUF2867 family)
MDKLKILITGASGNVGLETIRGLIEIDSPHQIIAAGPRTVPSPVLKRELKNLEYRSLDFSDTQTFDQALKGIDVVFLLRPPQLADIERYFQPFIHEMLDKGIRKVVFLSVQGVENQKHIPHHKLEKLINQSGLEYVFLRPGYFMQNLTTTLIDEIRNERKIFIPSGKLRFNWVDARDIGLTAAHVLNDFNRYRFGAYEVTGSEFMNFYHVAALMSEVLEKKIQYESPLLLKFILKKRKKGVKWSMIFVMIMLHYLPRFGKNKVRLTGTVEMITGRKPGLLRDFLLREAEKFYPM